MIEISRITHQRYSTALLIVGSLILGMVLRKPLDSWYGARELAPRTAEIQQKNATSNDTISQLFAEGSRLIQAGETTKAAGHFKALLTSNNSIVNSLIQLGSLAFQEEQYENAATYFRTALQIEPSTVGTYMRLGLTFHKLKDYRRAENTFRIVTKNAPTYGEGFIQLARVFMDTDQLDEAVEAAKRGIELSPENIHAHLNLGHIYNKRGETDNAMEMYRNALKIDNDFANANYNLGYTLRLVGKLRESIPYLEKALRLQPYYPDAHIALAQAYWSLDDFDTAWKHYYYRWQLHGVDPEKLEAPLWDGSDLTGKTILLYAEQGMGDTLQFVRFAKEVKKRGAQRVICKVQGPLKQLLSTYPYIDKVIGRESANEKIDAQAALMSLPGILKTTPKTIPADIPYLKADPALVQFWKEKLAHDKNLKVGICWSVDPEHETTKSPLSLRSVPLNALSALSTVPGVSFYSLQKSHDTAEFNSKPRSFKITTFGPEFDEEHGRFMDTVALIENLDLVISVDTAVIHVAGALGKPAWVILPSSPDCRWYFEGEKTQWYPTMRMFRQSKYADFATPINKIKKELAEFVQKRA